VVIGVGCYWWLWVVIGGCWLLLLVVVGGYWWLWVVIGGCGWLLVVAGGCWRLLGLLVVYMCVMSGCVYVHTRTYGHIYIQTP